ncbi:MAG TPA: R3H domain-containing nucleic acid-binding protein [Thermoanaerobaculia bacterium]|jgi:predicted RNA-binding protein Jag
MAQRFEGRNLEDALQTATQSLAVERSQLTYRVLLEKRGFLGGVKRVVIEVDVNEAAPPPPLQPLPPLPFVPDERPARAPHTREGGLPPDRRPRTEGVDRPDRPRPGRGPSDDRGPRGGGGGGGGGARTGGAGARRGAGGGRDRNRGPRPDAAPRTEDRSRGRGRGRGPAGDDALQPGDFEKFINAEVPAQGAESEAAVIVRGWCEQVISLAKLELEVRTEENDTQVIVRLYGLDSARLLDQHGELLDAIQVLANKTLTGRKIEKEIEFDCLQFKEKRTEELRQRALEVAERVRSGGREELLPAMTPIERRIVHLTLQDDPELTTDSRGDGFYKRVAIMRRSE